MDCKIFVTWKSTRRHAKNIERILFVSSLSEANYDGFLLFDFKMLIDWRPWTDKTEISIDGSVTDNLHIMIIISYSGFSELLVYRNRSSHNLILSSQYSLDYLDRITFYDWYLQSVEHLNFFHLFWKEKLIDEPIESAASSKI